MTLLAIAEQIERCLSDTVNSVQSQKNNQKVTLKAAAGKQTFVITIEETAKDHEEPAIT